MVSRAAFMDVGGFDQAFAPAYYEDTSLAFALRARDLRVVYQPESVVVHYEGVTSGTDTSQGVKSFQVRNKELFFDRWRSALAEHGMPGEAPLTLSADRRPRARVLIIDACTPTPDRDSGSEDLWNFIDIFGRLDYRVVFIPASNLLHYGVYTSRLQQQGVECIFYPFAASVQGFLRERGEEFDVVMLMRVDTAADHIGDVRRYCRRAKVVFNTVDLHFLREERRAQLEGAARLLRAGDEEFKTKEIRLMRQSDACVVISEVEASVLAQEAPDVRVHVIPLLRRIPGRTGKGFEGREGIVFIGGFRHPPNVDAMLWFCREVLPDVRRRIPGVELSIIGSDVTSEIEALEGPGVRVLGYVEDIAPLFGRARLSVAPLRYGAGLKGKIATSLGYGVPCVATQIAVEGMGIEGGALSAFIADTADAFAEAIDRCYRDSDLWEQASEAGLRLCRERFAVEANVPRVKALLTDIGLRAD
jgi:glycosyltransferase involved in cell wall biosynthesis